MHLWARDRNLELHFNVLSALWQEKDLGPRERSSATLAAPAAATGAGVLVYVGIHAHSRSLLMGLHSFMA